jgi:hypothetical protein
MPSHLLALAYLFPAVAAGIFHPQAIYYGCYRAKEYPRFSLEEIFVFQLELRL